MASSVQQRALLLAFMLIVIGIMFSVAPEQSSRVGVHEISGTLVSHARSVGSSLLASGAARPSHGVDLQAATSFMIETAANLSKQRLVRRDWLQKAGITAHSWLHVCVDSITERDLVQNGEVQAGCVASWSHLRNTNSALAAEYSTTVTLVRLLRWWLLSPGSEHLVVYEDEFASIRYGDPVSRDAKHCCRTVA
jgi:hypothetical protein